jgi:hypothetical protein
LKNISLEILGWVIILITMSPVFWIVLGCSLDFQKERADKIKELKEKIKKLTNNEWHESEVK